MMNSTSLPATSKELLLLEQIHSSWLLDSLFLFVLSPLSLVSMAFSLLSFAALSSNDKHIYQYLRIHALNSVLSSLVMAFSFVSFSPRYFAFALELAARYYRCVVLSAATTLYFFKNVLDVLIALERLSLLVAWLRRFRTKSPHTLCLGVFVACAVINSPTYFIARPKSDAAFFNITTDPYPYCDQVAFFKSALGKTITFSVFFVRDLLPIVVEIMFSVLAVQQLHRFRIANRTFINDDDHALIVESERQLVVITLYILCVSLAIHLIIFLLYLAFSFAPQNVFGGWLMFLALLSLSASFILNFFIVYFNSRLFRGSLKAIFFLT